MYTKTYIDTSLYINGYLIQQHQKTACTVFRLTNTTVQRSSASLQTHTHTHAHSFHLTCLAPLFASHPVPLLDRSARWLTAGMKEWFCEEVGFEVYVQIMLIQVIGSKKSWLTDCRWKWVPDNWILITERTDCMLLFYFCLRNFQQLYQSLCSWMSVSKRAGTSGRSQEMRKGREAVCCQRAEGQCCNCVVCSCGNG